MQLLAPSPNRRGERMAESRGRKGKKAAWQLSLGIKDAVFAGLGVAGLMMMSFALGALAGRGDIYRVAYNWGLMGPEASKTPQILAPPSAPPTPMPVAPAPSATPTQAQDNNSPPSPVKGSLAPPVPASGSKKSAKAAPGLQKQKEEEVRKLREEMARKLRFQNSLDPGPAKTAQKSGKQKQKEGEKAAASKPAVQAVKVAQFRDKKAAQAKLAELQKQGEKATLQEGKDKTGTYYTVYRQPAAAKKTAAASANTSAKAKTKKTTE